ncbi:hypothetical protein F966_00274 [Acinetobacter higginsii]|uniref:Glycosyltransferase 2-like domain-containing protein n=1 Tax=Acinetobacter higginsii TaxID=70347 RepID=N8XTX6_9GAMM|nr:glycosyltransferase [Acinetobacter higginsii]ENV10510.1 hypothetical protein F966_00274 [Acinetobacter higginsii]
MKQSNPQSLVSVVVPCYNHENYVEGCIQSIIEQTYQNIELIIIDDGSKDNSVEKIQQIIPRCIERFSRFEFRKRSNKGLTATLNEALEWCKGEYYIVIASDDLMLEDRVIKQVEFLAKNLDFYACSGSQLMIDEFGSILSESKQKHIIKKEVIKTKNNIFSSSNNIYSPTTMFRMSAIVELGYYDEDILIEDLYVFYMAAHYGMKHYQMTDILTKYRVHGSNNHKRFIWMHENKLKILSKFEQFEEYEQLKKLVYLEGFYSIARYSDKGYAKKMLKDVVRYFYSPLFLFGCIFLLKNKD